MPPDLMPLLDIFLAVKRALAFIEGCDAPKFHSDGRTQWAVYSQIIVIGEASRRISREFQAQHPQIPWSDIVGMRNRLVHDYDDIDWALVWDTVINDLPKLKAAIAPLIPKEP